MQFLNRKLKSSALQFSLFVSVLIALLLFGLLLYIHSSKILQSNIEFQLCTIENCNQAIQLELNKKEFDKDSLSISISSQFESKETVFNEFWGGFQRTLVQSKVKTKEFQKTAFLGSKYNDKSPCLFLEDTQKPLVVVGNTKIEGLAYLPNQGIKPGTISGNSYYGSELVYGNIKFSNSSLPKLREEFLEYLENIVRSKPNDYLIYSKTNSFKEKPKYIYQTDAIILNQELIGNIVIKSESKVVVTERAILKDVLIIAPKVEIQDNVKGNFNLIATEEIVVGEHVNLNYPSSLIVKSESKENQEHKVGIEIGKSSTIIGQIIFIKKEFNNIFETDIFIEENSKVKGEIYCQGNLELKSNIEGSVYTKQFITRTNGTVFINHLYNVEISNKDFSLTYAGILFDNSSKNIAKWLY